MQQWVTAIEAESVNNDFVAPSPIYDLLHVCPQDLALYWIGRYEYLLGNTCEAFDRFTSSSKLNPAHAASHLWMGRCLDRLDRSGDALKAFAAAAHLAPYLAEAQFEYGRALCSPEIVSSAALAAATAAVSADLNFDEARLLKGRLSYEMGNVDSAYSEFSILAARHPDSAEYRIWKRRAFDDILQDR
ncbi:hypothetical protein BVRB_033390 [Beta vulgaris subsp. vulgaris]|uniref:Uncharacterized protein n=1 Tax=Beta vulgaris subsp. vulgaris TaxID=3555 RepID=A0A0J8AXS1_BETVV|nr:hypothetical protein BVRB_033390 [Beta vulgaris subsp. vulgaris]